MPCNKDCASGIAERGDLELMKWYLNYVPGCLLRTLLASTVLLMLAIESGNVELVAYLRERGHTAPLHHGMMSAAAQRGHLAMCAYLRESGCTWGFDAFSACARHREGAGFAWLLEHGCCGTAKQLYTAAVYNDDAT
eukprot:19483-Heterococcus_DN1.PRE.6